MMKVFDKVIKYFSLKKAAIPVHSRSVRYETLTPNTVDEEKLSEYFNAINYAMHQKDVRNIAVTGPYGAGKSTIIYSYFRNSNVKHINVSLAGFDISGRENTVEPSTPEVELSILQQILYKENRDS